MSRVAVLGSGMVAGPAIRTLLDSGHEVLVATDQPETGRRLVGDRPGGEVRELDATDREGVERVVREADLAISLLPVPFHARVARACLAARRPFVTTSYVSDEMRDLDGEARRKDVLLLNEVGADPGIDHMQAMRIVDGIRAAGGTVTGLRSLCGGIPSPSANDNPFGYKLSWSPRGVVLAGTRPARFVEAGSVVSVDARGIFSAPRPVEIPGVGMLESYPNGDSVRFREQYALPEAETFLRGSLRWPGWCETWDALSRLGWLDTGPLAAPAGSAHGEEMLRAAGGNPAEAPRAAAARALGRGADHPVLERLEWLGLFSPEPVPASCRSRADILVDRMQATMSYRPGEADMLVLHHEVEFTDRAGSAQRMVSWTVQEGNPDGESAMARCVGLPAAFAAGRILDGTIRETGVRTPLLRGIYEPLLADLAAHGIRENASP